MSGKKRRPSKPERGSRIASQLRELRGITGMTGMVHDAQAFQLRAWGWGAFPHVKASELEIEVQPAYCGKCDRPLVSDWSTSPDGCLCERPDLLGCEVRYSWKKHGAAPKDLAVRLAALVGGVWELLGPEWRVSVKQEGKLLFQGNRKVEIGKARDERREGLRGEIERLGSLRKRGAG